MKIMKETIKTTSLVIAAKVLANIRRENSQTVENRNKMI
jgi:hypothetical protein